jgi:hypothetical protein
MKTKTDDWRQTDGRRSSVAARAAKVNLWLALALALPDAVAYPGGGGYH